MPKAKKTYTLLFLSAEGTIANREDGITMDDARARIEGAAERDPKLDAQRVLLFEGEPIAVDVSRKPSVVLGAKPAAGRAKGEPAKRSAKEARKTKSDAPAPQTGGEQPPAQ